ncbi:MAG TPA: sensor domain-containing diguanylate cyclase [Chloroflexia bacterium]|nr:sensor domain-containing diguanylate cyclase [Chloroflexia bacterium]
MTATPSAEPGLSEVVERLRWVIGIRWTVVVALLLVGIIGRWWRPDTGDTSLVHITLAILVGVYNLFYYFVARNPNFGTTRAKFIIRFAQIPVDLLVFTAIVHFSGGVTGPVFVLYFLYIFVGLAILPPVGAYIVAALSAVCYGGLALIEAFWLRPHNDAALGSEGVFNDPLQVYTGYVLTVSAMLMIIAYIANYFAGLLTRDEHTIRRQLNEMNTLYGFTQTMSTTLNSEEAVRTLVATAVEIEGASTCSLLLLNERGEGVFAAAKGFTPEQSRQLHSHPLPPDHKIVKMLLAEGSGIYAPDVNTIPELRSILASPETCSFYAIPTYSEDRLIGTLNLSFDRPYTMPVGHWNLLNAMTQQAALAIERGRLFTESQRAAREMTSLYHVGLVTISSIQIDEVLHLIYEQVNRVLHPDTFYIALYDEERGELRYDLFIEQDEPLPPFRKRLDNVGISSWIIRNRKPVFIRDLNREVEQLPFETNVMGAHTRSSVSVPLIAKNKIVGVMSVQSFQSDAFDQNHLRLLTLIASQAALALENATLHATVNEQAQRDPLTGVYHHGTFIDKLHISVSQAQAEKQPVALIMLDIDRFKQYNDSYGHLVGDDVLRSTVTAIQGHLKGTDVVGRWGGEEFGIILPGVNRSQARIIAERIRETVARNIMRDMHNRSIPSPTVSQGIAMYPEDATHIEELIDKADMAMFRAKDLGRNRIAEWIEMGSTPGTDPLQPVGR